MSKLSILIELWKYIRIRKKWWLVPILVVLFTFGAIMVLTEGTVVAPFIYAIFWIILIKTNYIYNNAIIKENLVWFFSIRFICLQILFT